MAVVRLWSGMQLTRAICGLAWCVYAVVPSSATMASDLSSLLTNNPFEAYQPPPEKRDEPPPQWELRGAIKEKDGYLLSFYDIQTKKSFWVKEGEPGQTLFIRKFNDTDATALAEVEGRSFHLVLKSFHSPGPVRSSVGLVASLSMSRQGQASRMAIAPPESEAHRLEAAAREVRQLRALRRKSVQENSKT